MSDLDQISQQIQQSAHVMQTMAQSQDLQNALVAAADACINSLRHDGKILLAGNGGSASDCQHIAGEIVGRFLVERPGLAALALTTDSAVMTAIANDYGYDRMFERQIEGLGKAGDTLIAYSTSGNSANIIRALAKARAMGITTVGFTGNRGGSMLEFCDHAIEIPSSFTPNIQEGHLVLGHLLCGRIEQAFCQTEPGC